MVDIKKQLVRSLTEFVARPLYINARDFFLSVEILTYLHYIATRVFYATHTYDLPP